MTPVLNDSTSCVISLFAYFVKKKKSRQCFDETARGKYQQGRRWKEKIARLLRQQKKKKKKKKEIKWPS